MMKRFFLTFLLLIMLASPAWAATYYVATSGNNSNPGTESEPWATLSWAAGHISDGDTVIVRGGTYAWGCTISKSNVTFQNYSEETPIIDGNDVRPGGEWAPLIEITASGGDLANNVTLDGLVVKDSTGYGIEIDGRNGGADNVIVRNCEMSGAYHINLVIYHDADDALIEDCDIHHGGKKRLIKGENDRPLSPNVSIKSCEDAVIRRCTIRDSYWEAIDIDSGSKDTIIEYCTIYGNYRIQLYLGCSLNTIARYNLIYGTNNGIGIGGIVMDNEPYCIGAYPTYDGGHIFYGNLVANTANNFAIMGANDRPMNNITAYNNTFVEATETGIRIDVGTGHVFKNNIVLQSSGTVANISSGTTTCDYNLWSREPDNDAKGSNDPDYAAPILEKTSGWSNLIGGDLDGTEFFLEGDSPAIDTGVNLGSTYENGLITGTDYSSSPIVTVLAKQGDYPISTHAWDIGANIYIGGGTSGNSAPVVTIDTPATNQTGTEGDSWNFSCTGTDADSDDLTYDWDGDGGATISDIEDPGSVTFNTAGSYAVTVVANDGTVDSQPDSVIITVNAPVGTGNNFSNDANCISVYRFESGAMTTDTMGNNTLTASADAPDEDTTNEQEGSCCADFDDAVPEYYTVADDDLSADFPLKEGTSNKTITVLFWYMPDDTNYDFLVGKYGWDGVSERSLCILRESDNGRLQLQQGYNSGQNYQYVNHGGTLTDDQWYHIAFAYQDSDKTYKVRVYDKTAGQILQSGGSDNLSGNFTNAISLTDAAFTIGQGSDGARPADCIIDEVVVRDDFLSDAAIDLIRQQNYGAAPTVQSITTATANGEYQENDSIGPFTVTFSQPVVVTGTPTLEFETGDSDAKVNYSSGTGTQILTFAAFTVGAGYETNDLDNHGTDALDATAGGATIVGLYGGTAINATCPAGATAGSLASNKAIVIDTTVMTMHADGVDNDCVNCTGDSTITDPAATIRVCSTFSETVDIVYGAPGFPRLKFDLGLDTGYAEYSAGLGTTDLEFVLDLSDFNGPRILDLDYYDNSSLELGDGGTIQDGSGNEYSPSGGLAEPGAAGSLGANAAIVIAAHGSFSLGTDGDYADFSAFDTDIYSLPDDTFTMLTDITDDMSTDGAGTSGHPISYDGDGHTLTGTLTVSHAYWNFTETVIDGNATFSGGNQTIKRCTFRP
jgi:hypothetical protein